jgi:hypothetical protein
MDMTRLMIKALMSENLVTLHVLISSKLSLCDLKGGSPRIVFTSCMYAMLTQYQLALFYDFVICLYVLVLVKQEQTACFGAPNVISEEVQTE